MFMGLSWRETEKHYTYTDICIKKERDRERHKQRERMNEEE